MLSSSLFTRFACLTLVIGLLPFAAAQPRPKVPVAGPLGFQLGRHRVVVDEAALRVRQDDASYMTVRWFSGKPTDINLRQVSPAAIAGTVSLPREDFVVTYTRVSDSTLRVNIGRSRGPAGSTVQAVLYLPAARYVGATVAHAKGEYVLPEEPGRKEFPKANRMTVTPAHSLTPFTVRMVTGDFADVRDYRAAQSGNAKTFQVFVVGKADGEVEFEIEFGG